MLEVKKESKGYRALRTSWCTNKMGSQLLDIYRRSTKEQMYQIREQTRDRVLIIHAYWCAMDWQRGYIVVLTSLRRTRYALYICPLSHEAEKQTRNIELYVHSY